MIRDFDPTQDYPQYTALFNAAWPDSRRTADEMRGREQDAREYGFLERRVIEEGEGFLAEASLRQWPRWTKTGRFWLTLTLAPDAENDGLRELLFQWATTRLALLEARTLFTWTRSDRTQRVAFLRSRGFAIAQEEWMSAIDLDAFAPERFHGQVAAVLESGIELYVLPQLRRLDADWFVKLHDVDNAAHADVPDVIDFTPRTAAQLRRRLQAPDIIPEGYFVAVDVRHPDRPYVGLSRLGRRVAAPTELDTGLTGVRREYRRRGIALTMKVAALRWARAAGYSRIWTANDKRNPMYDLNLQLGFEPRYAGLTFEKQLT